MSSVQTILVNALIDINVLSPDETAIPSDLTSLCLSKFNRRVSNWNARASMGSYEYTQVFTLPASPTISPNGYSIGATADSPKLIVTAGRAPTKIDSAKRLLGSGSNIYEVPIPVLAFEEWDRLSFPGLPTNLTLAVYLQTKPKLPILWCYGFASGEQLRLSWKVLLNTVAIADIATDIDWQDGAEHALTCTLSEDLARSLQKPIPQDLKDMAREARLDWQALNNLPPVAYPDVLEDSGSYPNLANFLSRDI